MANYPNNKRSFAAQFQLIPTVPKFFRPSTGQIFHEIINNNFYAYVDSHRILIGKNTTGDFTVTNLAQKNEMNNLITSYYP